METTEVKEKELITIFEDKEYKHQRREEFVQLKKHCQEQVNKFMDLELGELSNEDLVNFLFNPREFTLNRWTEKQIAPPGWERERYLSPLTKPDFSFFTPINSMPHGRLFKIENWTFYFDTEIEEMLLNELDYVLEKDSRQHKLYKKLCEFEKLSNEINKLSPGVYFDEKNPVVGRYFHVSDKRFTAVPELKLDIKKLKYNLRKNEG